MSRPAARHRYRAWDGRPSPGVVSPDELLEALGDRFLSENPDQVLNDLLHRGLATESGDGLSGIDALRAAIREQLQQFDPSELGRSMAGSGLDLSDEAAGLLSMMAAQPLQAGRLLAGSSPGVQAELSSLGHAGGPLQRQAAEAGRLLDLAKVERDLRQVARIVDVESVSVEAIARALDDDIAASVAALIESLRGFRDQGYIDPSTGGLSAVALRKLGRRLLRDALAAIESRISGDHDLRSGQAGGERSGSTREYRFGDPFDLDLSGTLLQAVRREPGTPVRLAPGDMTIFDREETGRVAMVLAIDRSRSMGGRGYLLAAKKLALALATLVRTRFPRDELDLLTFAHEADAVTLPELAAIDWERYAVGTNVHDALVAGRSKLTATRGLQRVLTVITDGEPTAHRDCDGEVQYAEPPTAEALAATYAAARQLRREQILLIVVLLSRARQTVDFARQLVRESRGRLLLSDPDELNVEMLVGYPGLR